MSVIRCMIPFLLTDSFSFEPIGNSGNGLLEFDESYLFLNSYISYKKPLILSKTSLLEMRDQYDQDLQQDQSI